MEKKHKTKILRRQYYLISYMNAQINITKRYRYGILHLARCLLWYCDYDIKYHLLDIMYILQGDKVCVLFW